MKVLTVENDTFDIDEIPDFISDVRYSVLEYSDEETTDFYVKSLLFLESFNDTKAVVNIGDKSVSIPLEWSVIIGDQHTGDLEVMPITTLNDRDFDALVFNPISGFRLDYRSIQISSIYPDVKWYVPKLGYGQLLALPLSDGPAPDCIFVTHAKQNKVPEVLNINWIF